MNNTSAVQQGRIWLNRLAQTVVYAILILSMGLMGAWLTIAWKVATIAGQLPEFSTLRQVPGSQTIRIYASDGTLIHSEGSLEGKWINYENIPKVMQQAMISIEDRRFHQHNGIDLKSLLRVTKYAWESRHILR